MMRGRRAASASAGQGLGEGTGGKTGWCLANQGPLRGRADLFFPTGSSQLANGGRGPGGKVCIADFGVLDAAAC